MSGGEPFTTSSDGYSTDWNQRRKAIYRRDDFTCQSCGARGGPHGDVELHAHHIIHKSNGGSDHPSNLTTLCYDCHNAVHDHHIPRGDYSDSARDYSDSARDEGHVLNVENLQHMYKTGEIDFDEFENRLERSLEERGLQRDDRARDESDSARDDSEANNGGLLLLGLIIVGGAMAFPPVGYYVILAVTLLLGVTLILYVTLLAIVFVNNLGDELAESV